MRIIEIDKSLIPYRFRVAIEGSTFEFEVFYNLEHDYFTVDLWYQDILVVQGEKLVLGKQLFTTFRHLPQPKAVIVPLDLSNRVDRITFDNFGKDVFLYVSKEGDFDDI